VTRLPGDSAVIVCSGPVSPTDSANHAVAAIRLRAVPAYFRLPAIWSTVGADVVDERYEWPDAAVVERAVPY